MVKGSRSIYHILHVYKTLPKIHECFSPRQPKGSSQNQVKNSTFTLSIINIQPLTPCPYIFTYEFFIETKKWFRKKFKKTYHLLLLPCGKMKGSSQNQVKKFYVYIVDNKYTTPNPLHLYLKI